MEQDNTKLLDALRNMTSLARECLAWREVSDDPEDHEPMIMSLYRSQCDEAEDLINIADDCAAGLHSWIELVGVLSSDTVCEHCGELYGDPD